MFARLRLAAALAACSLGAMPALAHTVWLVPEARGGWHVLFGGHAGVLEDYAPSKLKTVTALAADGASLAVSRSVREDGVHLAIEGRPSLILAHYDNGIHTTRSDGPSVERPMHEVRNALRATRAIKYHKTIAAWSPLANKPAGQPFEVVPVSAQQPRAGQPMRVQVLIDGRPAAGIGIAHNEEGRDAVTDARGFANFTPVAGLNKLWAGKRTPVSGNRAFTEESIEYSLGFFAR